MPSPATRIAHFAAVLLLLLCLPPPAFGQAGADPARQLAEKLSAAHTEAEREALLAGGKEVWPEGLAEAVLKRAEELRLKGNLSEALELSRYAQALAERLGDRAVAARAVYITGVVYYNRGEYDSALDHYRRSLPLMEALGNRRGVANALTGIGLVHRMRGDFEEALKLYARGLALSEEIGDRAAVANALNYIGVIHRLQGNRRLALENFRRALALFEEAGDRGGVTGLLNNIGNVYLQQGQYDLAEDSFLRSLELAEESKYRMQAGTALNNLGRVLALRADHAGALEFYRRSLALREELGDRTGAARALTNLAETHTTLREYDPALDFYRKALALLEATGNKPDLALVAGGIARLHHFRGEQQSAVEWAERAAGLARETERLDVLWLVRGLAGGAHRALGRHEAARAAYTEAVAAVEELRWQVAGGEQEQQRFFENKVSPYHSLVELSVEKGEWAEALAHAERAKARVLLDVLQSGRAGAARGMSEADHERERRLRGELVALNAQLSREAQSARPDAGRLAELRARRQRARLDYEAFRTNLYAARPELKVGRGEVTPVSLAEAGTLLPDARSAIVEYVLSADKAFLFVLTKNAGPGAPAGLKVYTLDLKREELVARAERFRVSLARRDLTYARAARELYDLLLRPAEAQLRGKTRLVIVPDGKLWELPFQALQDARGRHLIEDHAISYAPSLTVLREMVKLRGKRRGGDGAPPSLLALGNPSLGAERTGMVRTGGGGARVWGGSEDFSPLPEAARQVRALAGLYGPSLSSVYTGGEAREGRFKAEAPAHRVLQLATHGVLDDSAPMYSHVLLAREEAGGAEDGLLEAWELMGLDLGADLVVLSACETARGRFGAGEGVIGMTWALFVAGSPTTVVSQWKVEASSTTELMLEFHRRLRQPSGATASKAAALQGAARRLLGDVRYRHPFYWAGFVMVGDGD